MAKKSIPVRPEKLSFDGGYDGHGGFGDWHPQPLSQEELKQCATDDDGKWQDEETASYCAGCLIGTKAAEEYLRSLRAAGENFWDTENDSGVAHIALAMMAAPTNSPKRRRGEIVGFFGSLYPYLAFGARTIGEADKKKGAARGVAK